MALTVALLGAESTGKTTLSHAMAASLRAAGHRVAVVPEALRAWCLREGRAPHPSEHAAIAQAHESQVDAAAAQADIVIADTTALMVAVYGGLLFEDGSLHRWARERQRGYGLTLVTGLDLPWTPDGLHRVGPQVQGPLDAQVREALRSAGVAFRVVYGRGDERTRNALAPVQALLGEGQAGDTGRVRWSAACEHCGDPACERRLFRALRGQEVGAAGA